ncbi:MAG TPA: PAS domain S-box protein, partial [Thermoanaerobaculia bacterium]|nr:PAS domain S-box protein [Thermoanaerobaculia bacterium]
MDWRRYSLATVVAALLVTATTVLLGGYFIFDYVREAKHQREMLGVLTDIQLKETCVALALPVWNIDGSQIERILEAMARPESIYAIRVDAAGKTYGRIRNRSWDLVRWDGKVEPRGMVVYQSPVTLDDREIGTARIYVSLDRVLMSDLHDLRLRLIETVVVVDLLMVACVYLLLSLTVLRPVRAIERYALAVSHGDHYNQPVVPAASAELDSLCHSIETMVKLLDERYIELQSEMARRAESEDRFVSIFESVNDAILVQDVETTAIIDANQRACEMFGYAHEEMVTLRSRDISSGDGEFTEERVQELFRSKTPMDLLDWHCRNRNGQPFWAEASLRVANVAGEPRAIVAARDITQRKEMQEALRRGERMSAIGSLVAGVAHEVRNPLFGIAATLDAFEAEFGVTEETKDYLVTLRNDVSRLTRLMNDLLEFGRPQDVIRHVQSIEPLVAETIRVCRPKAREKQVEIRQQVAPSLPRVSVDADRMLQVFKNVVENAIDHSKSGDAVDIRAERDG